jgi:hypothetical protein
MFFPKGHEMFVSLQTADLKTMLEKPVAHRINVNQRIGIAMRMRMLVAISRVGNMARR